MLRTFTFTGCLIVGLSISHARDLEGIPLHECTFPRAVSALRQDAAAQAVVAIDSALSGINELKKFTEGIKFKSGVPLIEQLSGENAMKYGALINQAKAQQLASLIASHRQRDMRVLEQLVMLADQEYRWERPPVENERDHTPYAVLLFLRENIDRKGFTNINATVCSVELALQMMVNGALVQLSEIPNANANIQAMQRLVTKSKQEQKLTDDEMDMGERLQKALRPVYRVKTYIDDLRIMQLMSTAADLNAQAKAEDLIYAAGDISKMGSTVERLNKEGRLDPRIYAGVRAWYAINTQIPADAIQETSKVPDASKSPAKKKARDKKKGD